MAKAGFNLQSCFIQSGRVARTLLPYQTHGLTCNMYYVVTHVYIKILFIKSACSPVLTKALWMRWNGVAVVVRVQLRAHDADVRVAVALAPGRWGRRVFSLLVWRNHNNSQKLLRTLSQDLGTCLLFKINN